MTAVARKSTTTVLAIDQSATVLDGEVVGGQAEIDNSALDYVQARAVINIPDAFGGVPAGEIDFYMVEGEVDFNDGTPADDCTALGYAALTTTDNQTDPEEAKHVGSLAPVSNAAYRDVLTFSCLGVRKFKLYLQDNTGQSLVFSASNITVHVTLMSPDDDGQ